jgi:tetratricopeptide (TPR) repeat protein
MIKGNQAFKEQQWQKAISYYNEAIKLNDKNATYYSNRAAAYLELGRYFFILERCCIGILLYLLDILYFLLSVSNMLKQIVPMLSTLIKR